MIRQVIWTYIGPDLSIRDPLLTHGKRTTIAEKMDVIHRSSELASPGRPGRMVTRIQVATREHQHDLIFDVRLIDAIAIRPRRVDGKVRSFELDVTDHRIRCLENHPLDELRRQRLGERGSRAVVPDADLSE
ncbi:hypothetical protein [Paraburkholderia caballeronis]|nr:hypothetical protein [Paraburkholderia caballeronis]